MTPGHSSTPPSFAIRFSSSILQRTSIEIPRPPSREARTLLELSSEYITRESRQSSSFPILNQPDSRIQQDSPESASLFRTRKIPSNRQDTRISPTPECDRFSPRLLIHRATALHSSPQLRALSRVLIQSSKDSPDFCGFVGCDTRAPSPLFSSSSLDVLCPFVGLLVYGHRPF